MFNVTKTELKKMVSRPGIYVLSILLAIILVLGIFIYKPDNYKLSSATLSGKNYQEKLLYFTEGDKKKTDESIEKITNAFLLYNNASSNYQDKVKNQKSTFENSYSDFKKSRLLDKGSNDYTLRNNNRLAVLSILETLNTTITEGINNSQLGAYTIVSTKSNYKDYETTYNTLKEYLSIEITSDEALNEIIEVCDKNKSTYFTIINNFYFPTISNETYNDFTKYTTGTKLSIVKDRLETIELRINDLTNKINSNSTSLNSQQQVEQLTELANNYIWTGETYTKLANYTLLSSAFDIVDSTDKLDLLFLDKDIEYNVDSSLIRFDYLFTHNKFEASYANPLTIGVSSNQETNAFDYAYFAMKLFGIIIIIYALLHACSTIAGEIKDGSLRYFAMRPVRRSELLFGKFFATIIMSLILIIFSGIISTLVGGAVYGFSSNNILTVFSSNNALILSPISMILIYMISLFVELLVYVSIAYLLSCILKSDLLVSTIVVVLFLINSLLPAFVSDPNSWLAFYPFSHISIYSLFGSNLFAVNNNFFNLVFGAKVYVTTNILCSFLVPAIIIIICFILSAHIFKKKEL